MERHKRHLSIVFSQASSFQCWYQLHDPSTTTWSKVPPTNMYYWQYGRTANCDQVRGSKHQCLLFLAGEMTAWLTANGSRPSVVRSRCSANQCVPCFSS